MSTHKPHTEVYEDAVGEYRWRLFAANGEQVAQGESYTSREDAERGLATALETAVDVRDGQESDPE